MKKQIYPCLWFDNQAKEAATFYCSIFKNSKIISETQVVTSFKLNGKQILGLNGGPMFQISPSISFVVNCDSVVEANRVWDALIDGGHAMMEIDNYPWSERYGWLIDKFNMTWQISSTGKGDGKLRFLPCFLFTDKKFGKAGEAIKFYSSVFENATTNAMVLHPENDPNEGKVMYSEFSINGSDFIAMDGPGEHNFDFNEGVSLVLECENQKEIDYYWEKLTVGGEESMCGWLKDKFGVSWQIIPAILPKLMADPKKAPGVFESFKNMRKLEIDKLKIE
jgi:predicted 3-demethylubiquinone-9 3-methyltransferase (glyoxalase superfamily)